MASTQMNIRIEESVKRNGDAAFAAVNYTPTQAVRALWDYAARHQHDSQAIARMLAELEGENSASDVDAERKRKIQAARKAPIIISDFFETQGLRPALSADFDDDALLKEAYDERYSQNGFEL